MSLFGGFCEVLSNNHDCLKILVKIIDSYPHDAQMLLRSCFILGNVVARYPEPALFLHKNGAIVDSLLSICKEYKGKLAEKVSKDKQHAANKDVLCKAVRLLTNLLQNEEIAVSISPQLIKFLISLGEYSLRSGIHEVQVLAPWIVCNGFVYLVANRIYVKRFGYQMKQTIWRVVK
eukprot:sb/3471892/